jgi:DNA-binding CsgD family transcriptional regulator
VSGTAVIERHEDRGGRRYLYLRAPQVSQGALQALSDRERQVVSYRAYGQSLKRIGLELGLSVPTVGRTLARARSKLGLVSDVELPAVFGAALRARRRG